MAAEFLALGLLAFLLTYWLHSTVLLGLAWLVTRRLPVAAAGLREGIWRVALFGGFITAGVQSGLGLEPPLGRWVLQPQVSEQVETAQVHNDEVQTHTAALEAPDVIGTGVVGTSAAPLIERVARPARPTRPEALRFDSGPARPAELRVARAIVPPPAVPEGLEGIGTLPAVAPAGVTVAEPVEEPHHSFVGVPGPAAWPRWIAGAWLAAILAVLGGLVACRGRLRRGLAGREELTEGPLAATLERLQTGTGLRPAPRLFVAPRITVPLCTGVLRPTICIPPRALLELSPAEQEAMLAHELGHLVRRDPIWICLTWVAQNVFFFQPLNRIARRELLATAELLADDWATSTTGQRLSLASCLTRIAGWVVGDLQPLLAPQMTRGTGAGRSHLGVRVERLLEEDELPPEPRRRWLAPAACVCLASLALGVPGFAAVATPIAPEPEPEPVQEHELLHVSASAPVQENQLVPASVHGSVDPLLALDLKQLDQEVLALKSELAQLRAELEGLDLKPSIQRAVSQLERRARELADRRGRVNSVVWEATPPGIRP